MLKWFNSVQEMFGEAKPCIIDDYKGSTSEILLFITCW